MECLPLYEHWLIILHFDHRGSLGQPWSVLSKCMLRFSWIKPKLRLYERLFTSVTLGFGLRIYMGNRLLKAWVLFSWSTRPGLWFVWWKCFDMLPSPGEAWSNVSETFLEIYVRHIHNVGMLIKFNCLMPELRTFMSQKSESFARKVTPVGPGLFQWYVV